MRLRSRQVLLITLLTSSCACAGIFLSGAAIAHSTRHSSRTTHKHVCLRKKHRKATTCKKQKRLAPKPAAHPPIKTAPAPIALPPGLPPAASPSPSPQCPATPLPTLPSGEPGATWIVGGMISLSGGPAGTCASYNTPLGGTITVTNQEGATVTTATVAEGEYFKLQVQPGTYYVTGVRDVPGPLQFPCGPATSTTTFTTGAPVTIAEGQTGAVYCAGDIP